MKNIYFNSAVARRCGKNGIIKAVLLNYVYNFYRQDPRKKSGYPASITLAEFVFQYSVEKKSLWKRSYIHKTLTELCKSGLLTKTEVNRMPEYTVSSEIAGLLNDENAVLVGFDLGLACEYGIQVAIMSRYLLHVIDHSPRGIAYNLKGLNHNVTVKKTSVFRGFFRLLIRRFLFASPDSNRLLARLKQLDIQIEAARRSQLHNRELAGLMLPSAAKHLFLAVLRLYWFLTLNLSRIRFYSKVQILVCSRRVSLWRIKWSAYLPPANAKSQLLSNAEKVDAPDALHDPVNPCPTKQKSASQNGGIMNVARQPSLGAKADGKTYSGEELVP